MVPKNRSINISIIIPAHNAAETLTTTLESVVNQTHASWEAIVVDDGSTDRTSEIANQFAGQDARIRAMRQKQAGEAAARNAGISQARYDWLLFLDADDWISKFHLERMSQKLDSEPELDAVICRSVRVAANGTEILDPFFPQPGDLFPILARRPAFNVHACIVRRTLVEEVGRFDSRLDRLPDWDLWQKIARTGARFGTIDEILAFYRMRADSISLDVPLLLRDGLTILRRGHGVDSRISKPLPKYSSGMPPEQLAAEEIYFVSWCAGIKLGKHEDPTSLLEVIDDKRRPQLYANAIADCLFFAALLPTCESPDRWETLLPLQVLENADKFLRALEEKTGQEGLGYRGGIELRKLVLRHSHLWKTVMEDAEKVVTTLEEFRKLAEQESKHWENVASEREKWRTHWENISQQRELELKKWEQLANDSKKWRTHWENISREKELELKRWEQLAEEREKWRIHWQNAAERIEREREEWKGIAADREKWLKHWQDVAAQAEKQRDEWEQIAEGREKWLVHWRSIAERLEKEVTLPVSDRNDQESDSPRQESVSASDPERTDP